MLFGLNIFPEEIVQNSTKKSMTNPLTKLTHTTPGIVLIKIFSGWFFPNKKISYLQL